MPSELLRPCPGPEPSSLLKSPRPLRGDAPADDLGGPAVAAERTAWYRRSLVAEDSRTERAGRVRPR